MRASYLICFVAVVASLALTLPLHAEPCTSTLKIYWTDLFGEKIDLINVGGFVRMEVVSPGKPKTDIDPRQGIRLPCGRHRLTSFIPGGRHEVVDVNLTEGLNIFSIGVRVGSLVGTAPSVIQGKWPDFPLECTDAAIRAVALYGQFPPMHAKLSRFGDFRFVEIPEGRYAFSVVSDSSSCRVHSRSVVIRSEKVEFGLPIAEPPAANR